MQQAFYSVFMVEQAERGLGIAARDLVSDKSVVIVDLGLGSTAKRGLLLAGRAMPFDEYYMTTGAALPLGFAPKHQLDEFVCFLSKTLLNDDGTVQILQGKTNSPPHRPSLSAKVGRNDRCPCGSGKKYKQCCLQRE
jgi:hypothetical protein